MDKRNIFEDFSAWKKKARRPRPSRVDSSKGSKTKRPRLTLQNLPTEILDHIFSYTFTQSGPILVDGQYFNLHKSATPSMSPHKVLPVLNLSHHLLRTMITFYKYNIFSMDISSFAHLQLPTWPHGENYTYPYHDATGLTLAIKHVRQLRLCTTTSFCFAFTHTARILAEFKNLENVVIDVRAEDAVVPMWSSGGITVFHEPTYVVAEPPAVKRQHWTRASGRNKRGFRPNKLDPPFESNLMVVWKYAWIEKKLDAEVIRELEKCGVRIGKRDGESDMTIGSDTELTLNMASAPVEKNIKDGARRFFEKLERNRLGLPEPKRRTAEDEEWDQY